MAWEGGAENPITETILGWRTLEKEHNVNEIFFSHTLGKGSQLCNEHAIITAVTKGIGTILKEEYTIKAEQYYRSLH